MSQSSRLYVVWFQLPKSEPITELYKDYMLKKHQVKQ